ncbi:MAG: hypothetical protein ACI814_003711, partial [Mariniblastus sp.]
ALNDVTEFQRDWLRGCGSPCLGFESVLEGRRL